MVIQPLLVKVLVGDVGKAMVGEYSRYHSQFTNSCMKKRTSLLVGNFFQASKKLSPRPFLHFHTMGH